MGIVNWLRQFKLNTPSVMRINGGTALYAFSNTELANNETIFAAVSMLANTMASLPITLRKGYSRIAPGENNIASLLAYGPNKNMTTFEFIRLMEVLRNIKGVAYAIKEYDYMMDVVSLEILDGDYVTPFIDKETKELWYRISTEDGDEYFHNSHIITVSHITTDGYSKLSPLEVLKNTLDYDKEIKQISINQLKNGLHCNIAFKLKDNLSEKQIDEYTKRIKRFREIGVLFLDGQKEIQELKNATIIDPKVFEVEKITIARVARVFNIPVSKLAGEAQAYKSSEQDNLIYATECALPVVRMYEQAFSRGLLSQHARDSGEEVKINLNGLARADMKTRSEYYFKMIRSSGITPNEVRGLEDFPPLEGGDDLMVSRDLIKLKDLHLLLKGGE